MDIIKNDMDKNNMVEETKVDIAKDWWYDVGDCQTNDILIKHRVSLPIKDEVLVELYDIYNKK